LQCQIFFVTLTRLYNEKRSTLNAQRSTLNAQRSTLNAQRSTLNAQRSTHVYSRVVIFLSLIMLLAMQTNAQNNLILNGNFEQGTCPINEGSITFATSSADNWLKMQGELPSSLFQLVHPSTNPNALVCTTQIPYNSFSPPPPPIPPYGYRPILNDYQDALGHRRYLVLPAERAKYEKPKANCATATQILQNKLRSGYYKLSMYYAIPQKLNNPIPPTGVTGFAAILSENIIGTSMQIFMVSTVFQMAWTPISAYFSVLAHEDKIFTELNIEKMESDFNPAILETFELVGIDGVNLELVARIDLGDDIVICKGDATTLGITNIFPLNASATNCQWSAVPGMNGVISGAIGTTLSVAPSVTTRYTLRATVNGYPVEDEITVRVLDLPKPIIQGSVTTCSPFETSSYTTTFPTTPSGGNVQYSWSVVGGHVTTSNGTNTVGVDWAGGQNVPKRVMITTRITDPATGISCQTKDTLNVYDCCETPFYQNPKDAIEFITETDALDYFRGVQTIDRIDRNGNSRAFVINGTLRMNQSMNFEGVDFHLAPDAKIILEGTNINFNLRKCNFIKCNADNLWQGIFTEDATNTINAQSSEFKHAKQATKSVRCGAIILEGCIFRENVVSARVDQCNNVANSPLTATANQFWIDNGVAAANNAIKTQHAIYANKIAKLYIGDVANPNDLSKQNIFRYNGSSNNYIEHKNPIVIRNSQSEIVNNKFIETNTGINQNDLITNAYMVRSNPHRVAVWAYNMYAPTNLNYTTNTKIYNNNFRDCHRGVFVADGSMQITNNKFNDNGRAIEVFGFAQTGKSLSHANFIANNQINPTNDTNDPIKTIEAIDIQRTSPNIKGYMSVLNNQIRANAGIDAYISTNMIINNNSIELTDPTTTNTIPKYGIRTDYATNTRISNNTISAPNSFVPSSPNRQPYYGIYAKAGAGNLHLNTLNNLNAGIVLAGNHSIGTQLTCNTLNQNYNGMYFRDNAILANQIYNNTTAPMGNQWIQNLDIYRISGALTNTTALCYVDLNTPEQYLDNSNVESSIYNKLNIVQSTDPSPCKYPVLKNDIAQLREQNYRDVIDGNLKFEQNAEENQYFCHQVTYRALANNDTLLHTGDPTDADYIHYLKKLETTNHHHINNLYNALENHDLTQAWQHYYRIHPTNLQEKANQQVNHILLATTDTLHSTTYPLDKQQTKILNDIARQNPLLTGEAVIRARALLGIKINDEQTEAFNAQAPKPNTVATVYPNPAQNYFDLQFTHDYPYALQVVIYDAIGKVVNTQTINYQDRAWRANATMLTNGFHTCKVINVQTDEILSIAKIIIAK
jgi:hypothetical protein